MKSYLQGIPFKTRLLLFITILAYAFIASTFYYLHTKEAKAPGSLLAPHIGMGPIELKVANFPAMEQFYEKMIGMQVIAKAADSVTLGYRNAGVIKLDNTPKLQDSGANDPGLDQIAIVFNSRAGLAKVLKRVMDTNPALYAGGTDRGAVGEAFYVTDPQGNSLELYYDTDPSTWPRTIRGNVESTGNPIDITSYITEHATQSGDNGMKTGHLQIRVGDITKGRQFYVDTIGFYPIPSLVHDGSLFLSDGFYHHDLVINQAQGYDGDTTDKYLGLKGFSFSVPNNTYLNRLKNRLKENNISYQTNSNGITFSDAWGIHVTVTVHAISLMDNLQNII